MEVGGGGRERDSENQRWREMGEAAFVRCEEVIATPRRMEAGLLGQQEWSLQERFMCPPQIGPIFSYRGSSRGSARVALSKYLYMHALCVPLKNQNC